MDQLPPNPPNRGDSACHGQTAQWDAGSSTASDSCANKDQPQPADTRPIDTPAPVTPAAAIQTSPAYAHRQFHSPFRPAAWAQGSRHAFVSPAHVPVRPNQQSAAPACPFLQVAAPSTAPTGWQPPPCALHGPWLHPVDYPQFTAAAGAPSPYHGLAPVGSIVEGTPVPTPTITSPFAQLPPLASHPLAHSVATIPTALLPPLAPPPVPAACRAAALSPFQEAGVGTPSMFGSALHSTSSSPVVPTLSAPQIFTPVQPLPHLPTAPASLSAYAISGGGGFMPAETLPYAASRASDVSFSAMSDALSGIPTMPAEPLRHAASRASDVSFSAMSAALSGISGSSGNTVPSPSPIAKVKALFSSGGSFVRGEDGHQQYSGGETRLISLGRDIGFEDLLHLLSRSSIGMVTKGCSIRYELPGCPHVLVDVVNDDDVANMVDEFTEAALHDRKFKLHIYVQLEAGSDAFYDGSERQGSGASLLTATTTTGPDTSSLHDQNAELHRTRSLESQVSHDHVSTGSDELRTTPPDKRRISLHDLETCIDILRPEDLRIMRFLGSGGYGEVYLAKWHASDVAVKCLNPSLFTADGGLGSVTQEVVEELLMEVAVLASLRHPNIVWVYGIVLPTPENIEQIRQRLGPEGYIDAVDLATAAANAMGLVPGVVRPPALVTEYLAGGSLRSALTRNAEWLRSSRTRIKIAMDAAKGMEYLHARRIVHFDLKSGNLLIGFNEKAPCAKVADFGLSKQRMQTYVTGVTSMRGTLPWIAPEIIRTPKAVNEKADIYSFGIVLWELWTGREPYEGANYHALLHSMSLNGAMRPPLPGQPDFEGAEWEGEVPEEPVSGYSDLMQRCWQGEAGLRPSFSEIVHTLHAMLESTRPGRSSRASSAPV